MFGLPGLPGLLGRAILRRAGLDRAELGFRVSVLGALVLALAKPERALIADPLVVDLPVGAARGRLGPVVVVSGRAREMMSRLFAGRFFVTGLRLLRNERYPVHVCRVGGERWAGDLGAAAGDGGLVGF
ncbi:hypothetical protein [Virgisporangium aurantiacum]|uniref:hypothetical protein n=1 Tax=Virgisporangium aurantiacum TaxID=175570 RepID=UPI00194E6031|nr:hypothetical protein [Virgisporangium aurantiacum]